MFIVRAGAKCFKWIFIILFVICLIDVIGGGLTHTISHNYGSTVRTSNVAPNSNHHQNLSNGTPAQNERYNQKAQQEEAYEKATHKIPSVDYSGSSDSHPVNNSNNGVNGIEKEPRIKIGNP